MCVDSSFSLKQDENVWKQINAKISLSLNLLFFLPFIGRVSAPGVGLQVWHVHPGEEAQARGTITRPGRGERPQGGVQLPGFTTGWCAKGTSPLCRFPLFPFIRIDSNCPDMSCSPAETSTFSLIKWVELICQIYCHTNHDQTSHSPTVEKGAIFKMYLGFI